jgi:hypothetical protein
LKHCCTSRQVASSLETFIDNPCGADSAVNRNEYQEYLLGSRGVRCGGLTTLPPKDFCDEKHSALQL